MFGFFREFMIIGILTVIGAVFSLYSGLMSPPWQEPVLAAGEIRLRDIQALDVIWIDARTRNDYDAGHVPEAILLNEPTWDDGIHDLMGVWLTDTRPIIVYCSSAQCDTSKRIAARLREALPEAEIYSLKGGWEAWKK